MEKLRKLPQKAQNKYQECKNKIDLYCQNIYEVYVDSDFTKICIYPS